MGKSIIMRAGLLGAAIFISAAGAAWEVHSEGSERMTYYDLDFDGRPYGYLAGLEDWLRDGDGPFDAFVVTKYAGSWFRYSQFVMGFDYGGLDVIRTGDGEYLWVTDIGTPRYAYRIDVGYTSVAPASFGKVKAMFR
jgi:hypothetical protein